MSESQGVGDRAAQGVPSAAEPSGGAPAAQRRRLWKPLWTTRAVRAAGMLGFLYAIMGYVNHTYLHWFDSFWLSSYSDKLVIVGFGLWRVASERNRYTRRRIAILTLLIATLWILIPFLTGSSFFNHHLVGTTWFFAYLLFVFAFGRRADCSWNCPCVGLRDTAGEPFRRDTPKGDIFWNLRHIKWLFLLSILTYLVLLTVLPRSVVTMQYINAFWTVINALYFASFLLIPWTGNRNYCRYMCPWGSLYGLISKLGFYRIMADAEKCTSCGLCERQCDMGIPVMALVHEHGQITVTDCVGCGRCVQVCPRGVLRIVDVRDYIRALWRRLLWRRATNSPDGRTRP